MSLDRDTGANKSKWLGLLKVLLQGGCSFHPLIARVGLRAVVPRLGAVPAGCLDDRRIWLRPISEQLFRGFCLVHMDFSAVLSVVPRTRCLWECGGNIYFLPKPLLDRAQVPRCRRAMRLRFGKKVLTDTASWKETDPHAQFLPKDESG